MGILDLHKSEEHLVAQPQNALFSNESGLAGSAALTPDSSQLTYFYLWPGGVWRRRWLKKRVNICYAHLTSLKGVIRLAATGCRCTGTTVSHFWAKYASVRAGRRLGALRTAIGAGVRSPSSPSSFALCRRNYLRQLSQNKNEQRAGVSACEVHLKRHKATARRHVTAATGKVN